MTQVTIISYNGYDCVRDPGVVSASLTLSDFQAWFLVYSASTSCGASLDRRIRGSRSGLVLSK